MTKNMLHAIPGMVAFSALFVAVILFAQTVVAVVLALASLAACIYSTVYVGAMADYWEERYRTHRNCGNRGDS